MSFPSPTIAERSAAFFIAPADATRMRFFECAFTASYALWMIHGFIHWREWLTVEGFHLEAHHLDVMGYPAPWPLLAGWQVIALGVAIATGVAMLIEGRLRRLSLLLLFATSLYVQRVDFMSAFTLNKLYIGVFGLLLLAPGINRTADGSLEQSQAPTRILQATLILQYFAAGLAKVDGDWLRGHDVLWGHVQGVYRTDIAAWALRSIPLWAWTIQQHTALIFEVGAPLLFCCRWLRPLAFLLGLGFHVVVAIMMKDLFYFSVQMMTFYLLFLPNHTYSIWNNCLKKETVVRGSIETH